MSAVALFDARKRRARLAKKVASCGSVRRCKDRWIFSPWLERNPGRAPAVIPDPRPVHITTTTWGAREDATPVNRISVKYWKAPAEARVDHVADLGGGEVSVGYTIDAADVDDQTAVAAEIEDLATRFMGHPRMGKTTLGDLMRRGALTGSSDPVLLEHGELPRPTMGDLIDYLDAITMPARDPSRDEKVSQQVKDLHASAVGLGISVKIPRGQR